MSPCTPTALASLYDFPDGAGTGQCIAIIELGGGYRAADLTKYFSEIKTASPKVSAVSIDHGKNHATALRCLGQRWMKILWKMWQTNTPYDEALHLKNQTRHGSWVLKLLPTPAPAN